MALPRRFWALTAWVIALATLATAFAVVEQTYQDQYALAGCVAPAPAPDYATCSQIRFYEGAARVAGVVAQVPALGMGMIALALAIGSRRGPPAPEVAPRKTVKGQKRGRAPQHDDEPDGGAQVERVEKNGRSKAKQAA